MMITQLGLIFLIIISYEIVRFFNLKKLAKENIEIYRNLIKNFLDNQIDEQFLETVVSYIKENIQASEIDIDEIIKVSSVNRSVFYSKFKMLTNLTPNEFINNIRLKEAARLLKETNLSASEISYEVTS